MTDATYNGWQNYETWNVALWIGNDEGLYSVACDFMRRYYGSSPWRDLASVLTEWGAATPDGVYWNDSSLATDELDEMLCELT